MKHENKFGMFIHWGIYAMSGVHEQVLARLAVPRGEYEAMASEFNPTEYDPEAWVLLAKEAGMKYICFTTKHHDGFCMWDTKCTDYNVMNTPYGRDVLKMLADACHKHGMLLSLYYSNPDWHHEYGYNPHSTHQFRAVRDHEPNLEKYKDFVKAQITELLTGYGPIYTFFWDIPPRVYDPSMNELIRSLQPNIYINDRGWDKGDFSTPEREYENCGAGAFERMTEACNSVGEQSWGYRSNEDFYSISYLTRSIDRYMAMGASYLLNVGPDARGVITPEYASRIRRIGDWYNRMEGALESPEADARTYDVKANDCIVTRKNGRTYFHFVDGVKSSAFCIADVSKAPKKARLLNTGAALSAKIEVVPEYFDDETGKAPEMLRISGIPIDDLACEPVVVEVEW